MRLNVKLTDGAPLPKHTKPGDAGLDLTTRESVTLAPGETKMVHTGVSVEIPWGYVGLVFPRSGLGSKSLNLSNCVGVIDSGYRGEILAPLHNNHPTHIGVEHVETPFESVIESRWNMGGYMAVERGERICQMVVVPFETCDCVEVDELGDSERGESGYGSSGRM